MAVGTWLLVFATIGLFVATYLLWRTTLTALNDARAASGRQADEFNRSLDIAKEALNATRQTAYAAERGNTQTRELFLAERRPWIKVTVEVRDYTERAADDVAAKLTITCRNVGMTPAMNVGVRLYHGPQHFASSPLVEAMRTEIEDWRDVDAVFGHTLFPGEEWTNDALEWNGSILDESQRRSWAFIGGYASYTFFGSKQAHFTPFVLDLLPSGWDGHEGVGFKPALAKLRRSMLTIPPS